LGQVKEKVAQDAIEAAKPKKEELQTEVTEKQPFTLQDLRKYWNEYVSRTSGMQRVILEKPIELSEAHTIILPINKVEEDHLQALREDLLLFLRRSLRNSQIQLKVRIEKVATVASIKVNAADKFEQMAELYPSLYELKEALGLELEF
jgi:hypothetical protein